MPFGRWRDFEECVRDFVFQGKDEDSARKICGYLQARIESESLSWVGELKPDIKNLIYGVAIHPVKTVHPEDWPNVRVYLEEELKAAAHTLVGSPLLLDHLYPVDGKVLDAWYEDGAMKYVAELNDQKILDCIRDGTIEHCSVELDWRSLEKVNGVAPRQIRFLGLALLKDYEPGDPRTSVEVWEAIFRKLKESESKTPSSGLSKQRSEVLRNLEKEIVRLVESAARELLNQEDDEKKALEAIPSECKPQGADQDERMADREEQVTASSLSRQAVLADQKKVLEAANRLLRRYKREQTERLSWAVVEPKGEEEDLRAMVLKELKAAVFERVPHHWGYGPYQQNRRLKELIKHLER